MREKKKQLFDTFKSQMDLELKVIMKLNSKVKILTLETKCLHQLEKRRWEATEETRRFRIHETIGESRMGTKATRKSSQVIVDF